jgi:hypothetical protein
VIPLLPLFLVAAARHYLWPHFPPELQGMASKGLGACEVLALLAVVWELKPSKPMAILLIWWVWEELQTALCSFAYMRQPWEVPPGVGICSAALGFNFDAAGILAVAWIAHYLSSIAGAKRESIRQNERH